MKVYTHSSYSYVHIVEIPKSEIQKIDLVMGKQPKETLGDFYDRETDVQQKKRIEVLGKRSSKGLRLCNGLIQPITYTPDIYVKYKDLDIWIECKGFTNDVFPYKKKMFRKLLDNIYINTGQKSIYFEIYTKKQLLQAIEIIKSYGQ